MPTSTIIYGDEWGAHGGSATHGAKGDGGMQSKQVPIRLQGEAGYACAGRMACAWGTWRCMGGFSKIGALCTVLSASELSMYASLSNHAGQNMLGIWRLLG